MSKKRDFNKKNSANVHIVQNIKNLIYEKNMTLSEGMLLCGYKTSHSKFSHWENSEDQIPMDSLMKIATGLNVDLFRIAPPSYFGINANFPEKQHISDHKQYEQHNVYSLMEEIDMLKDYIRLLKKENSDLSKQQTTNESE